MTIAAVRAKRAAALDALNVKRKTAFDAFKTLATKDGFKKATDQAELDKLKAAVDAIDIEIKATTEEYDAEIKRLEDTQALELKGAVPVAGQELQRTLPAEVSNDPYTSEAAAKAKGLITNKGLMIGGISKAIGVAGGSAWVARDVAKQMYGENHPVTLAIVKALAAGVGASGGFIVPPEYVNEIIELLRPLAVVRSSNPRAMPMPRGTMTLPAQTQAASASYGGETGKIATSQQKLGQIIASYKKLTAMVPVSNDLMRYADPAADAFVRDDLVKVLALREDLAFLLSDGSQDSPRGFTSFANSYAITIGTGTQAAPNSSGIAGSWLATGNSIAAVGGNFITSNETYTLSTVATEIGGLINKLDTANVPDLRRMWFMHPRSYNYLYNVQNSLGLYVYAPELEKGTLRGYPFKKTTQIPTNIHDATSAQTDCSFLMLVEMTDAMLLDSMQLELAVSREGTYTDSNGNNVSAFQNDQTLIRAIAEHDFQMRHNEAIAIAQFVRWAPAIS
jgi:HK97 family phage major capsid protein